MHANQAIGRLMYHRTNCRLLSTGALARKVLVDMTKVEAFEKLESALTTESWKSNLSIEAKLNLCIFIKG